jgi:hypothetical protein
MNIVLALVLVSLTIVGYSILTTNAQSNNQIWRDDLNYQSIDELQAAGWTSEHLVGVSISSGNVLLDQTHGDTAIHYIGHFQDGLINWKVEDSSSWVSGDHSGNCISAITDKHSYNFAADGWYSNFAFYHDGAKVYTSEKGTYSESKDVYLTLSMQKNGDQISCYYNGHLEYTYTEKDTASSHLIGVDAVSPWRGVAVYDYFAVYESSSSPVVPAQSDNVLSNPVVIGGIAGGSLLGVGAAVYYFFFAGGSSAASASAGAGAASAATEETASATGGLASNNLGGGTLIHSQGSSVQMPEGSLAGPNLVADATSPIKPSPNLPLTGNTTPNPQVPQSQPANSLTPAQSIQQQMEQQNQIDQMNKWKIQNDLQTQTIQTPQDITVNKAKTQDKVFQTYDQYLRSSNDPDAVADAGSGGSGGEA